MINNKDNVEKIVKNMEDYYVHTDCARVALFSHYNFLNCPDCKEYYENMLLRKESNNKLY